MSRKQASDTDITKSFCKSALELMFSYYAPSDGTQVSKIPRVKGTQEAPAKKETNQSFQSRLVDLRLRRAIDKMQETNAKKLAQAPKVIEKVEAREQDEDNIPEIFQSEPTERAEVPRYVTSSKRQEEEIKEKVANFRGRNIINWEKSKQEFGRRLEKSKKDGIERARRRMERMQASGRENDPSIRYYPNSTTSSCQSAYYPDESTRPRRPLAQIENR